LRVSVLPWKDRGFLADLRGLPLAWVRSRWRGVGVGAASRWSCSVTWARTSTRALRGAAFTWLTNRWRPCAACSSVQSSRQK